MAEHNNPYIAGAPVVEKRMFFGRKGIFEWIENSLTGKYVDHILVMHGQHRVGKTSVLKHIPNRLPDRYIPGFIDLQGRVSTSLSRFLQVNDGLLGALTVYSITIDPFTPGIVYISTPYGMFQLEDK